MKMKTVSKIHPWSLPDDGDDDDNDNDNGNDNNDYNFKQQDRVRWSSETRYIVSDYQCLYDKWHTCGGYDVKWFRCMSTSMFAKKNYEREREKAKENSRERWAHDEFNILYLNVIKIKRHSEEKRKKEHTQHTSTVNQKQEKVNT